MTVSHRRSAAQTTSWPRLTTVPMSFPRSLRLVTSTSDAPLRYSRLLKLNWLCLRIRELDNRMITLLLRETSTEETKRDSLFLDRRKLRLREEKTCRLLFLTSKAKLELVKITLLLLARKMTMLSSLMLESPTEIPVSELKLWLFSNTSKSCKPRIET